MVKKKINIADYIDYTLLRPDATEADIDKLCQEAIRHNFKGVCVHPTFIALVCKLLSGKKIVPISVVGFPFGATFASVKAFEAKEAIQAGAREIDMVMNISAMKQRKYREVFEDIESVVMESRPYPVKVILETSYLDQGEKVIACSISKIAGASFVKTSTGLHGGATLEDVSLMRSVVGDDMGVKASGGIRSYEEALSMIEAGACRIGTSSIIKGE